VAATARKRRLAPVDTWADYQTLFVDFLEGVNRATSTIRTYRIAVEQLADFMREQGVLSPAEVQPAQLIAWFRHLARAKPDGAGLADTSVAQRYRSIQAFFKYLVTQEGFAEKPLANIPPPQVPDKLVPVVPSEALQQLLKACSGTGFDARRDRAIIGLFIDTGIRLSEMAGLTVDDVDLERMQLIVRGKGRIQRRVRFVRETRMDLKRYAMERSRHARAEDSAFWLGRRGRMNGSGIYQMLKRRCRQAEISHIHPHQLRHTFAHMYLKQGGNEGDLMNVTGWKSRSMVARYGRSAAAERALDAHDRFSLRKQLK